MTSSDGIGATPTGGLAVESAPANMQSPAPAAATQAVAPAPAQTQQTDAWALSLPEGMQLNQGFASKYSECAQALGMNAEQASQLIGRMQPVLDAMEQDTVAEMRSEWAKQSQNDPEFGGEKLNENLAIAKRGLSAFDNKGELLALLEETGLGNHPAVIRFLYRAGQGVSEDGIVNGAAGSRSEAAIAARMYPSMTGR